jgi:hypothetical protein
MALDASDLPYSVKQQLLSQIRDQMGATEYDRLVSSIGEDEVINLLLRMLSDSANSGSLSTASIDQETPAKQDIQPWLEPWLEALLVMGRFIDYLTEGTVGFPVASKTASFIMLVVPWWLALSVSFSIGLLIMGIYPDSFYGFFRFCGLLLFGYFLARLYVGFRNLSRISGFMEIVKAAGDVIVVGGMGYCIRSGSENSDHAVTCTG